MSKDKANMKTYILELHNGDLRKVTVPDTWKVTFGPTIPFSGSKYAGVDNKALALRFYEGNKENLRAVFTDVRAFRDEDIAILERRTETQRQVVQQHGDDGMHNVEVEARVTQWKADKQEAPNKYLALLPNGPAKAY